MKDWKTWAIIALAAWCGILTWRDERNLDVAEEMVVVGMMDVRGFGDYAGERKTIEEVRQSGSAANYIAKEEERAKERRERAKKLTEVILRSVNKSNPPKAQMRHR